MHILYYTKSTHTPSGGHRCSVLWPGTLLAVFIFVTRATMHASFSVQNACLCPSTTISTTIATMCSCLVSFVAVWLKVCTSYVAAPTYQSYQQRKKAACKRTSFARSQISGDSHLQFGKVIRSDWRPHQLLFIFIHVVFRSSNSRYCYKSKKGSIVVGHRNR